VKAKAREAGEVRQLTLRIPAELHKALKVAAAQEGRSVAAVVTALIVTRLQVDAARRGGSRKSRA